MVDGSGTGLPLEIFHKTHKLFPGYFLDLSQIDLYSKKIVSKVINRLELVRNCHHRVINRSKLARNDHEKVTNRLNRVRNRLNRVRNRSKRAINRSQKVPNPTERVSRNDGRVCFGVTLFPFPEMRIGNPTIYAASTGTSGTCQSQYSSLNAAAMAMSRSWIRSRY